MIPGYLIKRETAVLGNKAVFIDRDGTVIDSVIRSSGPKKITAPFTLDELKFMSDAKRFLELLKNMGFLRIMVTNQPDVAHGYLSEDVWRKIHQSVVDKLDFDDVWMCRHRREDDCLCKKPSPLMLQAAACEWDINLKSSWMVGDTRQDVGAGWAAGCRTILMDRHYNKMVRADFAVPNLMFAFQVIKDNVR